MSEVLLDKDQWSCFVKVLDEIGKNCTDVDIYEGKIRQTNNSKTTVYCYEFPFNINLKIALVKNIVPLLKMFTPQTEDDKVSIITETDKYIIKDKYSTITIHSTMNVENEYISDDKFKTIGFETGFDIFDFELPEIVYGRISVIKNNFSSVTLKLEISEKASLRITSWSKTMNSNIYSNIDVSNDCPDELRKTFVCGTDAFDISLEGNIRFTFRNTDSKIQVLKLQGNFQDRPMTLYVRAMPDDKSISQT